MMTQRWCSRLRSLAAAAAAAAASMHSTHPNHFYNHHCGLISHRVLHTFPNLLHKPNAVTTPSVIFPSFKPLLGTPHPFPNLPSSPISLTQVRHITAKQRKRKLKSRKPMTPITSKVKKIKMKCYSSFKGRFRLMNDGKFRRWKEGKRHNAHLKSKKSKRRLRQPGIVPLAYAKVMKKLNFCG